MFRINGHGVSTKRFSDGSEIKHYVYEMIAARRCSAAQAIREHNMRGLAAAYARRI